MYLLSKLSNFMALIFGMHAGKVSFSFMVKKQIKMNLNNLVAIKKKKSLVVNMIKGLNFLFLFEPSPSEKP